MSSGSVERLEKSVEGECSGVVSCWSLLLISSSYCFCSSDSSCEGSSLITSSSVLSFCQLSEDKEDDRCGNVDKESGRCDDDCGCVYSGDEEEGGNFSAGDDVEEVVSGPKC